MPIRAPLHHGRGAMIVFRIKNLTDIDAIEQLLKEDSSLGQYVARPTLAP